MRSDLRYKVESFFEFIKINKKLFLFLTLAIALLVILQTYIINFGKECLGVVDSREKQIIYDDNIKITKIYILTGQNIEKGQPLFEYQNLSTNNSVTSIRNAEQPGRISVINYSEGEIAPSGTTVMSIAPVSPNVVYGFINEGSLMELSAGDVVEVRSIVREKKSIGTVVSMGNKIIQFPDRLQTAFNTKFFGRELIVSLENDNKLLTGEKVRIIAKSDTRNHLKPKIRSNMAHAELSNTNAQLTVATGLPLEASGLISIDDRYLLIASDELSSNGSPFWLIDKEKSELVNLELVGVKKLDDLESLTQNSGYYYSLGSLGVNPKGKAVKSRRLITRFKLDDKNKRVVVDRSIDMRTPLIAALKHLPELESIHSKLDTELEIEGFTIYEGKAYLALKELFMPDGSLAIFEIPDLIEKVQNNDLYNIHAKAHAFVKLKYSECESNSRITDILKTKNRMLILSTCAKSEKKSQVWSYSEDDLDKSPKLLTNMNTLLEGMAIGENDQILYLSSDRGTKKGSDVFKYKLSK